MPNSTRFPNPHAPQRIQDSKFKEPNRMYSPIRKWQPTLKLTGQISICSQRPLRIIPVHNTRACREIRDRLGAHCRQYDIRGRKNLHFRDRFLSSGRFARRSKLFNYITSMAHGSLTRNAVYVGRTKKRSGGFIGRRQYMRYRKEPNESKEIQIIINRSKQWKQSKVKSCIGEDYIYVYIYLTTCLYVGT